MLTNQIRKRKKPGETDTGKVIRAREQERKDVTAACFLGSVFSLFIWQRVNMDYATQHRKQSANYKA